MRIRLPGGHVQCTLTQERLAVGRHIAEVVHHHEHLHHGTQGVEQGKLYSAFLRDPVPLLTQVNMSLETNIFIVFLNWI